MLGWLRPVILLPPATTMGLTPQQLEVVLAHEFAHIKRHDYLVNVLHSMPYATDDAKLSPRYAVGLSRGRPGARGR